MYLQVVMKLGLCSLVVVIVVMVFNLLGLVELLLYYGIDVQKNYYLLCLVQGLEIFCFVLISFYVGLDVVVIFDVGIVCKGEYEGCEMLGFCVIWSKCYIILVLIVIVLGLVFCVCDLDGLLGSDVEFGIICVLILIDYLGVIIGCCYWLFNVVFQNGLIEGCDVFILMEWVIGGVGQVGCGWCMFMECLVVGWVILLLFFSVGFFKLVVCGISVYMVM